MKRVLFVPYALHDRDAYARTAREKFESLGKAGAPQHRVPRAADAETVLGRGRAGLRLCRGGTGVASLGAEEVNAPGQATLPQSVFLGSERGWYCREGERGSAGSAATGGTAARSCLLTCA